MNTLRTYIDLIERALREDNWRTQTPPQKTAGAALGQMGFTAQPPNAATGNLEHARAPYTNPAYPGHTVNVDDGGTMWHQPAGGGPRKAHKSPESLTAALGPQSAAGGPKVAMNGMNMRADRPRRSDDGPYGEKWQNRKKYGI